MAEKCEWCEREPEAHEGGKECPESVLAWLEVKKAPAWVRKAVTSMLEEISAEPEEGASEEEPLDSNTNGHTANVDAMALLLLPEGFTVEDGESPAEVVREALEQNGQLVAMLEAIESVLRGAPVPEDAHPMLKYLRELQVLAKRGQGQQQVEAQAPSSSESQPTPEPEVALVEEPNGHNGHALVPPGHVSCPWCQGTKVWGAGACPVCVDERGIPWGIIRVQGAPEAASTT